jgi:Hemerythrin HHE cation binding domain
MDFRRRGVPKREEMAAGSLLIQFDYQRLKPNECMEAIVQSIEQLIADHAQMEVIVRQLSTTAAGPPALAGDASMALEQLADALDQHLMREDSFIYTQALRDSQTVFGDAAEAFERAFLDLKRDWRAYLRNWSLTDMYAEWTTFRAETRHMMARLHQRISAENDLLYPLALQCGLIRLRAVA